MRPNWLATCKRCASSLTSLFFTSLAISEAAMPSRPKCCHHQHAIHCNWALIVLSHSGAFMIG